MNLSKAKNFIEKLHKNNLMFHFDDGAIDCLYKNNVVTLEKAKEIDSTLDEIFNANLDWGQYECPFGYAIYLEKL
tara:strand:- start:289 stop:513 length:225 start_codon:yes stop_codon:yes gene_type:complete